ncbi:MAG: hypothetical protein NVSMB57_01710 [Actinomycetota bacterium]
MGSNKLVSIALDGPASVADVRGGSVLGVKEIRIPTTGVSVHMMLIVGSMMLGLAVVGRKFVFSGK